MSDSPFQLDPALAALTGQGCYADDADLPGALHLAFARSQVSSGMIVSADRAAALAMPGVVAAHLGADLGELGRLPVNPVIALHETPGFPVLTAELIEAVGQPIGAVLAATRAQADDGAEALCVDVDQTPEPAPRRIASQGWHRGDPGAGFARAAHIVEATLRHPRLAPSPMEPRSIAVRFDAGDLTIWHSTQTPHRSRAMLARILGVDPDRLRVIAQQVGGAFGLKASIYPEEVFAVWAALHHGRSVRWTATRSEEFLSASHGRGLTSRGRLALDAQGGFLALEAEVTAPLGHWLPNSALVPAWNGARLLPTGYAVPSVRLQTEAVAENRAATGIYRGAGRPEANALMERLVDMAAQATGLDPFEIRRRNLLGAEQLPHPLPAGGALDSGDYATALERLETTGGYAELRRDQARRRAGGELIGIGLAFYVEPSGEGWESARVTCDGRRAHVASGSSSQGHSREAALNRIAATALDRDPALITVTCGDTATSPEGIGALASRSTAIGGSAVHSACLRLKARRDAGETGKITEELRYENNAQAWGYGAWLVMLSVDADTGAITIEQARCIDDTGVVILPEAVTGQILGGFAQGLGEALMERLVYDGDGQLLTGSFMDYAMPRAADVPALHMDTMTTVSPTNLLGAKGVGEAGTIGAPIAILNAACDALAPLGVTQLDMPLTPGRVWAAMNATKDNTP